MRYSIEEIMIGVPFLEKLPNSAKRAHKITQISPKLHQPIKNIAVRLYNSLCSRDECGIITGFPVSDTYETDGPLGAIILSQYLISVGISVRLILDPPLKQILEHFPWQKSFRKNLQILDITNLTEIPSNLLTIEYPGQNNLGHCHNMNGLRINRIYDKIESKIKKNRPNYWLAIGDGGNELGLGAIRKRVEDTMEYGKFCRCGCGGSIASFLSADDYLLGVTSNFACIVLTYELSRLFSKSFEYSWKLEEEIISQLNYLGIVDGITGGYGTVDALSPKLAEKIIKEIIKFYSDEYYSN